MPSTALIGVTCAQSFSDVQSVRSSYVSGTGSNAQTRPADPTHWASTAVKYPRLAPTSIAVCPGRRIARTQASTCGSQRRCMKHVQPRPRDTAVPGVEREVGHIGLVKRHARVARACHLEDRANVQALHVIALAQQLQVAAGAAPDIEQVRRVHGFALDDGLQTRHRGPVVLETVERGRVDDIAQM